MKIDFYLLVLVFISFNLFANPIQDWQVQQGNHCNQGYKLVSKNELSNVQQQVCKNLLYPWDIVQLAEHNILVGRWLGCRVFNFRMHAPKSLCKPKTQSAFYSDRDPDTERLLLSYIQERNKYNTDAGISPTHVFLVDYQKKFNTFLFRGSNPVVQGVFQYENLKQALHDAAMAAGVHLPDDYFLIDITLLNPIISPSVKVEQAFFNMHPDLGRVINHPVYGAVSNPNDFPESIRRRLVDKVSVDHVPALVELIRSLMLQAAEKPIVLFVHCEAGKDRTGEVIAGYRMYYQQFTYQAALAEANKIAERNISIFSKYGIMWFGYWLLYKRGIDVGPIN